MGFVYKESGRIKDAIINLEKAKILIEINNDYNIENKELISINNVIEINKEIINDY